MQNLHESRSEVFGGDSRFQEEWKSKLNESKDYLSTRKAVNTKARESLNSWNKVKSPSHTGCFSKTAASSKSSLVSLLSTRSKKR